MVEGNKKLINNFKNKSSFIPLDLLPLRSYEGLMQIIANYHVHSSLNCASRNRIFLTLTIRFSGYERDDYPCRQSKQGTAEAS